MDREVLKVNKANQVHKGDQEAQVVKELKVKLVSRDQLDQPGNLEKLVHEEFQET